MLAGDYNVVPTDLDIYPTKSWDRDALLQPESRAAYQRLLAQGWTDAIRALHPKEPMYTFWDYMRNRWERDGGLRLDHILLSSALAERLQDAGVDRQTRGMEGASDHAPVWVKLRDAPDRPPSASLVSGHAATTAATALSEAEKSAHPTGGKTKQRTRAASADKPELSRTPLLVIDGDSFAHRSYHALPKNIRRSDGKGAGAILGFANFLLRVYADEQPRAVIVGWDTLEAPTKRHEMFPDYQSGREFDDELIEQLCPARICRRLWICERQGRWVRGGRLLAAAVAAEECSAALSRWRAAIGIPFSSPRTHNDPLPVARRRARTHRSRRGPGAIWRRSKAGARLHRAPWRSLRQIARRCRSGAKTRRSVAAAIWDARWRP